MSLAMMCPTRGRPEAVAQVVETFVNTTNNGTHLWFIVNEDDPRLDEYKREFERFETLQNVRYMVVPPKQGLTDTINSSFYILLDYKYLGFIGDDHRFRTQNWDFLAFLKLEEKPGFLYGNDLLQGENLPTHVIVNSGIIKSLGWFALPGTTHLYVDNAWRELGIATKTLTYVPEIVIEHMHPSVGKAEWDENYKRVNANSLYEHDYAVFKEWLEGPAFTADCERIRAFTEDFYGTNNGPR